MCLLVTTCGRQGSTHPRPPRTFRSHSGPVTPLLLTIASGRIRTSMTLPAARSARLEDAEVGRRVAHGQVRKERRFEDAHGALSQRLRGARYRAPSRSPGCQERRFACGIRTTVPNDARSTGAVEGSRFKGHSGHLVKDRMDITGARWGLDARRRRSHPQTTRACGQTPTSTHTGDSTSTATPHPRVSLQRRRHPHRCVAPPGEPHP